MRIEAFKSVGLYPKNMIVKSDFNMDSTIYRGILLNAHKSINLLISYIFDELNSIDYYNVIMLDLPEIFETKVINLN